MRRTALPIRLAWLFQSLKPAEERIRGNPMTQSPSGFSRLWNWFARTPAAPDSATHLQVTNLTRNTILATSVELADSGPRRSKGLLGRAALAPGTGLWIVPCEAVHTFWMQFPIDLVYLDRTLRIKKLKSNVRPWRMSGCLSAHSVIELASGTIRETQTERGDKVEFSPAAARADVA
jgi:uncharacterized membrane protein (UPF0127 family)